MKVLFLTSTLPRFDGDQQAPFVLEQAVAWQNARPQDQLVILAPHDQLAKPNEQIDGVDVRRFRYGWPASMQTLAYPAILPNIRRNKLRALQLPLFLGAQYLAARNLVKKHQIDVIYAHWVMPQGVVAYLLHKRLGVRYILQNHSSDLSVFTKLGKMGKRLARAVLDNADAFFCVNKVQGVAAQEIAPDVIPNVLPMGLSIDTDSIRNSTQVEGAKYALGTISRLSRKKGLDHLIAAAEKLAGAGITHPIAIAGDGEDAARLSGLPKSADIRFPGFLSGEGKSAFFSDCFAMVFSSVASGDDVEGLPVALLEALAVGKPIIASADTNVTQLAEWPDIADAIEYLEDPTDTDAFAAAIERTLALTPAQVEARTRHLRKVAGRYRWDRLIKEYLTVIEKNHGS